MSSPGLVGFEQVLKLRVVCVYSFIIPSLSLFVNVVNESQRSAVTQGRPRGGFSLGQLSVEEINSC